MKKADLAALDRDALIGLVRTLVAEVESPRAEVVALKRSGKRQAAPFSKGTRAQAPKPPGRRSGQGTFNRCEAPAPDSLSEPPIGVSVAETACPECGGGLVADRVEDASVVDLPAVVPPRVRLIRVEVRRCTGCGATVRGRHPDLAANQRGVTAHHLGPRLQAATHHLHYGLGVPVRVLPTALEILRGVRITQGAITRDAWKQPDGAVGARYRELCGSIREAPYVHTDDTGWREVGRPAWLMVFETDAATVYQVRPRHRNEEVRERGPADYAGAQITDRGTSYNAELAGVRKQKRLAHVLRSPSEVLEEKARGARRFAKRLKDLLKQALALWHERRAGPGPDFADRVRRLKSSITDHLRDRTLSDRDNRRLQNEPGRCHDAGLPVRPLDEPGIEPTNNRAERALPSAVIARKMSQCRKTATGSRAFEAWTSVLTRPSRPLEGPDLFDALIHPAAPRSPEHPGSLINTGLLLKVVVTAANADDGTIAPRLFSRLPPEAFPRLAAVWADNKYRNRTLERWLEGQDRLHLEVIAFTRPRPESQRIGWA